MSSGFILVCVVCSGTPVWSIFPIRCHFPFGSLPKPSVFTVGISHEHMGVKHAKALDSNKFGFACSLAAVEKCCSASYWRQGGNDAALNDFA